MVWYPKDPRDQEIVRARARYFRLVHGQSVTAASVAALDEWQHRRFWPDTGYIFPGKGPTGWQGGKHSRMGRLPDNTGWRPGDGRARK